MMCCPIGTDVSTAAKILQEGGLVAFATETVYGLGANAFDARAVARIFEAKNRPHFDPIIVHAPDRAALDLVVAEWPPAAEQFAQRFWPGPLTLVLPKQSAIPDIVTSGLQTVAVRVPDHPVACELLSLAGVPVAAPSANPFGRISPTNPEHVAEMLGDRIDYILDGGACDVGVESTVLDLSGIAPVLLRPGGLPVEEIEAVIGPVRIPDPSSVDDTQALPAPGMLPRHYAPRTELVILTADGHARPAKGRRCGLLAFQQPNENGLYASVEVVSSRGDLREAAANFFGALRRLDALGLDLIVAESYPEEGLGRALNDRLRRAARK